MHSERHLQQSPCQAAPLRWVQHTMKVCSLQYTAFCHIGKVHTWHLVHSRQVELTPQPTHCDIITSFDGRHLDQVMRIQPRNLQN